ncbi:ABC transporter substrate-binding protein [Paenibacillus sacheonensis]|uniref:ABC transporter substrate-binding protein n=1 Tax=Paenibacillus sacheonensis TaxID=742054 RepID=A0A7X5C1B1_9BACL|nr:ABC transporter substrate-binding protein [Paenibacillus sacheonensis]MBM7564703.1 iron complex transport system substrate-binding protein [Paenibacillus sacheonensis]NBC69259.1 ABC transporter substrate-binding protein [Paenibacillus sacheonensis]
MNTNRKKSSFAWKSIFAMMIVAILLAASACGAKKANDNDEAGAAANTPASNAADAPDASNNAEANGNGTANSGAAGNAAQATVYPLTVKDVTGTELTFNAAPERIVTLVPSETEIVYALGAGESVVAVDNYSNYPGEAADKPKIGDMNADIEKIVSLKPDLVLASYTMSQAVVDKLRSLKLPVYATDPKTYDAVMDKVKQIGAILDKTKESDAVAGHMEEVRKQVVDAVKDAPKPNVYLEFAPGWTVGKGEFLDELITLAGGTNVATGTGWYEIDPEAVVKANPDDIVYASMTVNEGEKNPILAAIESRPGWNVMNAIKNKKVFEVDQDPLTRVGPRLAEGLLEIAAKLHPDLFK